MWRRRSNPHWTPAHGSFATVSLNSTLAYQGYGQGADRAFIAEQIRLLGMAPDLTLVLDVPEAIANDRRRARGGDADRYERLDAAFHARVRAGFREIAAAEPERCVLVDASRDIQSVHIAIMTTVWTRLTSTTE